MGEPPDPGGTTVPQPENFVTISTTGDSPGTDVFLCNESGMDTDCSQRTLKRPRQQKVLRHKRPKSFEVADKLYPKIQNSESSSHGSTVQPPSQLVKNLYKSSDKGPYIVHAQRIQDSATDNTTLHPVTFGKFLGKISVGSIINGSVKRIGRNRISLTFDKYEAANAFVLNESLEKNKIKAFIPTFNVTRMGVVRGVPHDWNEDEIKSHISVPDGCGTILKVRRINYKLIVDGVPTWKPSQTVVITFDGQHLPTRVFMCYNALPVELYTYPTVQCYNCCRFGHTRINCRSKPRCFKCGGEHSGDSCQIEEDNVTCISCSGSHHAISKSCPEYNRQKQIKTTMAERCISYLEASKLYPPVYKSFAEVLAAPPRIEKSISNRSNDSGRLSYKKTVFLKPRSLPSPSQGYDQVAHQNLVKDYDMPSPQNGCAFKQEKTNKENLDENNKSVFDIILALINFLSKSNSLPSNAAPFLEQICKSITNNVYARDGSSMELPQRDDNFLEDVNDDLRCFLSDGRTDRVLVFPPVSNYRRFLIHRCVEQLTRPDLGTFSIGLCAERRTVVCYRHLLLSDEACAKPDMGLTQPEREDADISHNAAAVGGFKPAQAQRSQPLEKIRSGPTKPRRPDRAVYVPRALRNAENAEDKQEKRATQAVEPKCPKSPAPRDKSAHGTPRKSIDKAFCNVYTPPHLRNQRSHTAPSIEDKAIPSDTNESVPSGFQVPNSDSAIPYSDNSYNVEVGESFYIGDYFANGQLGLYHPDYYSDYVNRTDEAENMALDNNIIDNDYLYSKDEDVEQNELKRASEEINRSSKRIIKQSFHSDVLVISDPVETSEDVGTTEVVDEKEPEVKKSKPKLEAKVSLKREENDWDAVFDDSGECLDPSLLEELTSTVGKVHITKAKNNYDQYQTRGQQLFSGPIDETFAHVVEVYDFPSEFKTNDLLSLFSEYKDTGFEIKWVDDTHALIVFSSAKIAAEVLSSPRTLGKCRPLHAATVESRNKAKKCAEFLQPYRQRPETCTALARRLVSGALGVRLSTARQERAEERRLITIAREKKRQAAMHKEAAWDGSLANQTTLDT